MPSSPIHISEAAQNHITSVLSQKESGAFFRISVQSGGCSGFSYDFSITNTLEESDHKIPCGDYTVLVDDMSLPFLKKATLDYEVSLVSSEFKIINPNASSSCGCGISFSV